MSTDNNVIEEKKDNKELKEEELTAEEYISQRFFNTVKNRPENENEYRARLYWFEHGFPKLKKVAEQFGLRYGSVKNYASAIKWKDIRRVYTDKAINEADSTRRVEQLNMEKKQSARLKVLGMLFDKRLDELAMLLGVKESDTIRPVQTEEDKVKYLKEVSKLLKDYGLLQDKERVSLHLPTTYNNISGDMSVQATLDGFVNGRFEVKESETDRLLDGLTETFKREDEQSSFDE